MKTDNLALLIGNDINNINNFQSRQELLNKIIILLEFGHEIDANTLKTKPFALFY